MPKLIIHLGLPKTGTTSLQNKLFPQLEGYLGKHERGGPELELPDHLASVESSLLRLFLAGADRKALREWAQQLDFDWSATLLISNEAFSRWKDLNCPDSSVWPVQKPRIREAPRRRTHPIVPFLSELNSVLPPDVQLITVMTLRAQKTYLPSHAAQSRGQSMTPIVRRIIRRQDAFILWDRLVRDLQALRGPAGHLTLLFEDGVEENAREIVQFCGLTSKSGRIRYEEITRENRRQEGSDSWTTRPPKTPRLDSLYHYLSHAAETISPSRLPFLRGASSWIHKIFAKESLLRGVRSQRVLRLTEFEASQIDFYTRASNDSLALMFERDLVSLGY